VTPRVVLAGGWEAAFYAFGAAALLWVPLWVPATFEVVVETETETSDDEKKTGSIGLDRSETAATRETAWEKRSGWFDEWRALTRTREVRAICAAQFAQSWGSYGLLSWLPTYFDEALGVPLGDLPAFTVLPYFIQGVVGVASGVWADAIVE